MDNHKERTLNIGGLRSPTGQALLAAISYAAAVEAWPKAQAELKRVCENAAEKSAQSAAPDESTPASSTENTTPTARVTGSVCFPAKNFGGQGELCDMIQVEASLTLSQAMVIEGTPTTLSGDSAPRLLNDIINKFPNGEITSDPVRSDTQKTICHSNGEYVQVELFVRIWLDTSETDRRLSDREDNPPELI